MPVQKLQNTNFRLISSWSHQLMLRFSENKGRTLAKFSPVIYAH